MADNNEGEGISIRGNEWEFVPLTASTYAAAPSQERYEPYDDRNHEFVEDEETSRAMFMSDHFVFPPSQHENLPLDVENRERDNQTRDTPLGSNKVPELDMEEGDRSDKKNNENLFIERVTMSEDLPGILFFDEKGNRLSIHGAEFEGTDLQGPNMVDEEQSIHSASKSSSFQAEANISGSNDYDDHKVLVEPTDPPQESLTSPSDLSRSRGQKKGDEYNGCGPPCEAWWKRTTASFYAHAKEANTFWSIFVAATLMGLVIIGQRWQQERWQVQQLNLQFSINDEKISRILGQITRLKDVVVGSHRRGFAIRDGAKH